MLFSLPVWATEQSNLVTPTAGPMSMSAFVGTYLNPAIRALGACNWGPSAPANGPGSAPLPYQMWCDTTTNPVVAKMYDGASWVTIGKLNTSTHAWTPSFQGTDLSTASTVTLGSNVGAWMATPSSANLRSALTDETGTGAAVFANSPALVTPTGIVKGDVGLGNVDNTSDATKNAASVTLTNKTFVCANQVSCVVRLTADVTGTLPLGNGGTGGTTAPTARASSALNVDSFTGHGDSIYTILATDRTVGTNASFTASRTWTLPAANAVNAGQEIIVADFQGTVTASNTLVISRAGSDTINGAGTSVTISAANGAYLLRSDGSSRWTAQSMGAASGGGVTSVTCGTGLSGGTITTSGTCAVSLTAATGSMGSNTGIANGSYTDGPTATHAHAGTWFASGKVTYTDTASGFQIKCKLWDGGSVVADSGDNSGQPVTASGFSTMALSGLLVSPTGDVRISCKSNQGTSSFVFNASGESKDSTVTVVRIQ